MLLCSESFDDDFYSFAVQKQKFFVDYSFNHNIHLFLQSLQVLLTVVKFKLYWHISEHVEVELPQLQLLLSPLRHASKAAAQQWMQRIRQQLANRFLGLMRWTLRIISVCLCFSAAILLNLQAFVLILGIHIYTYLNFLMHIF
jgi:hypothetical protein